MPLYCYKQYIVIDKGGKYFWGVDLIFLLEVAFSHLTRVTARIKMSHLENSHFCEGSGLFYRRKKKQIYAHILKHKWPKYRCLKKTCALDTLQSKGGRCLH